MNKLPLSSVLALLLCASASAQDLRPAPGPSKNPDAEWAALVARVDAGRASRVSVARQTREDVAIAKTLAASQLRQTAQAARDFYTAFPADSRAPQAKKLEATSLLQGVLPTDADVGREAFRVAAAYRTDAANLIKDRIAVAALMEAQRYSLDRLGRQLADDPPEYEASADRLRAEFGDAPEIFGHYLDVIDACDAANSDRLARRVIGMPAPDSVKRQAQVAVARHGLLGRPLDLTLGGEDGRPVRLDASAHPTILVVWSPRHGDAPWAALAACVRSAPRNALWVYLALDANRDDLPAARRFAPEPGVHCFDPSVQGSAAVRGLKLRRLPFIYTFHPGGELAGYGRPDELRPLLADLQP